MLLLLTPWAGWIGIDTVDQLSVERRDGRRRSTLGVAASVESNWTGQRLSSRPGDQMFAAAERQLRVDRHGQPDANGESRIRVSPRSAGSELLGVHERDDQDVHGTAQMAATRSMSWPGIRPATRMQPLPAKRSRSSWGRTWPRSP
jgi:hypothetical protein